MKITKKALQKWLENTAKEDWKAHRHILKEEKGYKNWQEFIGDSYEFGCGEPYDDLNWSAGYISALKAVIENLK